MGKAKQNTNYLYKYSYGSISVTKMRAELITFFNLFLGVRL